MMWQPSERCPDPAVRALDQAFGKYRLALASVEWSDIPNNRILRWDDETGTVSTFRKPAHHVNGDRQGRLVTCEHGTRRLTRTEHDGGVTVLADSHAGPRLNSPNAPLNFVRATSEG